LLVAQQDFLFGIFQVRHVETAVAVAIRLQGATDARMSANRTLVDRISNVRSESRTARMQAVKPAGIASSLFVEIRTVATEATGTMETTGTGGTTSEVQTTVNAITRINNGATISSGETTGTTGVATQGLDLH